MTVPGAGDLRSELVGGSYCLGEGLEALDHQPWGTAPAPWAPGRREEAGDLARMDASDDSAWCLTDVDIFRDLSAAEMSTIAAATPMKTCAAGDLLYTPHKPVEVLFILKRGRVRVFRVSADGRALTTAIITPGTIFGEMVLVGQHMYDSFAEALEEAVVCVMSGSDVRRLLLADPRIAARIAETLGRRLVEMERRLSDSVFKSVPQRVAVTLGQLAGEQRSGQGVRSRQQIRLTHDQVAALAGTSRETATKVLGEFADRGLVRLGRGRITLLDPAGIDDAAGG